MTNERIVTSLDYMQAKLRNLLQRAASALEAPDYLNDHERFQLVEELFTASLEGSGALS